MVGNFLFERLEERFGSGFEVALEMGGGGAERFGI